MWRIGVETKLVHANELLDSHSQEENDTTKRDDRNTYSAAFCIDLKQMM